MTIKRVRAVGSLAAVAVAAVAHGTESQLRDWDFSHAANRVNFKVSGAGRFHSACNGDATDLDTLSQPTMKAFNGRLVAVVAADAVQTGEIVLTAAAEGVGNATVILRNEPPADSMRSSML